MIFKAENTKKEAFIFYWINSFMNSHSDYQDMAQLFHRNANMVRKTSFVLLYVLVFELES